MNKLLVSLCIILIIVSVGTVVYHEYENWNWVDSVYFATTSITTGGSGMLLKNDMSKLFTVFYIISGLSTVIYAITTISEYHKPYLEQTVEKTLSKFNGVRPPTNRG